jgi:hypothetical protein
MYIKEKWLSLNTTKTLTTPLILIIPASLGSHVYQKLYIYIYIYLMKVIPETRRVHQIVSLRFHYYHRVDTSAAVDY